MRIRRAYVLSSDMNNPRYKSTMEMARSVASSGLHANWRAVETELHQLAFHEADRLFADHTFRDGIDALCGASRKD